MSNAEQAMIGSGAMSLDALDLSFGGGHSGARVSGDHSSAGTGGGRRRLSRRRGGSFCLSLPIIFEGDENACESDEARQFARSISLPKTFVRPSAEQIMLKMFSGGPFAAAVASGMGPGQRADAGGRDRHDEKVSQEADAILQSLSSTFDLQV